ncbi:hypothetical protein GCM10022253_22980 [Sphingomonas endophytica]|uniref:Outer membrane biosynthesis protein TonB n=1 Tax=Sphingomonas endophytica TaxID=869719 RepID=A0ABR6N2E1_9SPHN|nr:hypothetical protein [Sphingomonas endophytica]MBB5724943.1 outer membrane biosynthesis protein TonB [Sphingomonas endophytica]
MTVWRHRLALVALLGLGVAGCSKSEPEPPEMNMTVQELEPTPEPTPTEEPTPVAIPTPTPTPGNDTAILPPAEDTAPDAQMMDDASVTGMTARSDRSGRGDDFDTAPVETRRRD